MRLFKVLTVACALVIVTAFGVSFVVPYFRPVPTLAVGIYGDERNEGAAGAELTRRLLQRFPIGSSATALEAELTREGWGPILTDNLTRSDYRWRYVRFKRPISLTFVEVSTITWKSEDGRLTDIRGRYFRDAALKQDGWS